MLDLVGEEGYLRLPPYVIKEYVLDNQRKEALKKALTIALGGDNVLITGSPRCGKTAFMAYLAYILLSKGHNLGIILEGATVISNEHVNEGIILLYDDLPRMNPQALKSRIKNKA